MDVARKRRNLFLILEGHIFDVEEVEVYVYFPSDVSIPFHVEF